MMIMRRRAGETILIGDEIEIHIAEIGRSRVKIAIEAPRHVAIVAKEVRVTREENLAASEFRVADLEMLAGRVRGPSGAGAEKNPHGFRMASEKLHRAGHPES